MYIDRKIVLYGHAEDPVKALGMEARYASFVSMEIKDTFNNKCYDLERRRS